MNDKRFVVVLLVQTMEPKLSGDERVNDHLKKGSKRQFIYTLRFEWLPWVTSNMSEWYQVVEERSKGKKQNQKKCVLKRIQT